MRISSKTLLLSTALLVAACKGDKKNNDPLAQDPTLKQDLELANSRDTAVQPQLQDVATTPPPKAAPSTPAPAPRPTSRPTPRPAPRPTPTTVATTPTPPPPANTTPSGNTVSPNASTGASEGRVGTVAAGTSLTVNSSQRVCTNTNGVGDRFTATLAEGITASNGVHIPAGANAILEVTSVKRSEQSGDNMSLGIIVRSVVYNGKTYPVNAELVSAQTEKVRQGNGDAGKVAGGAVIGAVLGRILGGSDNKTKGTVIGAAGGAAAGAILARRSAKYDACIPIGGQITVRLNSPMQIQSDGAPSSTQPVPPTSSTPGTI